MIYLSYTFVFFTVFTLLLYYKVPERLQWQVLLAASLIFYILSDAKFLFLIFLFSFLTWFGAKIIEKHKEDYSVRHLKTIVAFLIIFNIGCLICLKWGGMELALVNKVFGTNLAWKLLLPLGMSFFTFQNVSYVIDVYRGNISAEKNFGHYFLYSIYFLYIVSGPINRYEQMQQQFFNKHSFHRDTFYAGMLRILWGLMKKMIIADRAAVFVNEVFDNYYRYRGVFILLAVLLFSLQLYMDFSGCMDIVIGVSRLFGIEMRENFKAPYAAQTTAEFWRRWHMSLTSWFRDYLYIPLGGRQKKYRNVMIIFLFSGMWHGAGIPFLVWGFLNGFYQIMGEATYQGRKKLCSILDLDEESYGAVLRKRFTTFVLIEFAWLFFRANGIREAFVMLRRMITGWNPWVFSDGRLYQAGLDIWDFLILLAGVFCVGVVSHMGMKKDLHTLFLKQSWICQSMIILFSLVLLYLFGMYGPGLHAVEFIYYNF